jgi:hypothetical protein
MFLYTGYLMNDICIPNIVFRDFDHKEYKKGGLSHGSSITAPIKQDMYFSKSRLCSNFL